MLEGMCFLMHRVLDGLLFSFSPDIYLYAKYLRMGCNGVELVCMQNRAHTLIHISIYMKEYL